MFKFVLSFLFLISAPCVLFPQSPVRLLKAEVSCGPSKGDYSVYDVGSKLFFGGELNAGIDIYGNLKSQTDFLLGKYSSGEKLYIWAFRLFYRTDKFLLGFSYQHDYLEWIKSDMYSVNAELYRNNLLSVTGSAGYEAKNFGENLYFGELFLNMYLNNNFMVSSGVSYAVAKIKQTRADIILKAEYAPFNFTSANPSFFVVYGGNAISKLSAGVKLYFDGNKPLKQLHDVDGFYSARFK